jgi:hypothetical protein
MGIESREQLETKLGDGWKRFETIGKWWKSP